MAGRALHAVVVGASTLVGKELIDELSASAATAWDIRLLDENEDEEGKLTSAGEEALVVHALSEEALAGADLVFFATEPELTERYWNVAVQGGSAVVDLSGALEGKPGFLVRSPWVQGGQRPDLTTTGIVSPHPAALMLALVSERLQRHLGAVSVAATVLEPASQAGAAGVDELHHQTVGLLSFQELPKEVFDAQVAFNVQAALGEESRVRLAETRARIRRDARTLLGEGFQGKLSLTLLQAPVFHGYAISAFVQLASPVTDAELRAALEGGIVVAGEDTVPSNQAATEAEGVLVSLQSEPEDEAGRWLLIAADNLRLAARSAVAGAMELAALRPAARVQ